ncbi:rhomboid family-domain-containing protein [Choanephora cucurbitarum]|nr:rhomboid family-domain-containing protein [Choanephora cucurbitarum]
MSPPLNTDSNNEHELQQRGTGGFQKLPSSDALSTADSPVPHHQQPQTNYYSPPPGQPYYGAPPPGQPYYGTPPPPGQPYYGAPPVMPMVVTSGPRGYDRPLWLRALIGPIQRPIFSHVSALVMAGVLIYEFVRYNQLTGNIIETNPFNYMIGPSFSVLVNTGGRFTPCIRPVPSFPTSNVISNCYKSNETCTVDQLCGFEGFDTPNQSFRLVLPIFMHAGVIHYLLNMLTHLRLGSDLERSLGTPRYVALYMASGIGGFVLSAMLSQNMTVSTGCSGALFGLIGYMFIDILVHWRVLIHPWQDLFGLFISTLISLVLGLLPGLDNFAHIGGFAVGFFLGIVIAPMRPMATKSTKIVVWIVRGIALTLLAVFFGLTVQQFFSVYDPSTICPNCKYFSCLPVNGWCDI